MTSAHEFLSDPQKRLEALSEFRTSGFSILTDVFSEPAISGMRQAWASVAESRRKEGKKPYSTLLMTHITNPAIAEIVRNRSLIGCVEGFLGGKIELIQSQLMHGTPGTKGFSPHQDNFYNRAEPKDGIIAAWIALEDVDESNGGLAVFPGSHLNGLVEARRDWVYLLSRAPDVVKSLIRLTAPKLVGQDNDSGVIERFVYAQAPEREKPVAVAMKAGSAVFMHGDAIHFSYPNRTADRTRQSLLANYVRVGTAFSAGRLTGRVPFDIYAH